MCVFDVEDPISAWREIHRRARKEHRCGSASDVAVCEPCEMAWQFFSYEHSSWPTPDWLDSAVRDCFDGADKTDPEAKVWRDVYAGMLKRSRAAQRAEVRA